MSHWRCPYTVPVWLLLFLLPWYLQFDCVHVYKFHVLEEQQIGYVIGKIDDKPPRNVTIVYSRKDFALLIDFNSSDGVIYTKKKIDREALTDDFIHFIVFENEKVFAEVAIYVVDINDNYPTFLEETQKIAIAESALIGERFEISLPLDADTTYNGLISDISLEPSKYSSLFTLEYKRNKQLLYLRLTQKLDRERLHSIPLTLVAIDNGKTPKRGQGYVNITVLDVNDNRPRFEEDETVIYLSENTSIPQYVINLNVTDNDVGENSRLSYMLSGLGSDSFEINDRGDIFVIKPLRYEFTSLFIVNVTAKDHGVKSLSSHTTLRIHVTDTNNHLPRIHVDKSNRITITENNKPNTVISIVTVSDDDTMKCNGNLTLVLQNYRSEFMLQRLFYVYNKNTTDQSLSEVRYFLRVMQSLDFEQTPSYNIKLKAFDDLYNTSIYIVKLTVTDVNDNIPIFGAPSHDAIVSVFTPVGSYITTVKAIDADTIDENKIHYVLLNTTFSRYFDIISDIGVILTADKLPSSLPEILTLNISASDSVHSTSCLVKVHIKENPAACIPEILTYPDHINVDRYSLNNLIIAKYETNDCPITWTVAGRNNSLFVINERGQLRLSPKPSIQTTLILTVIAWNAFNPKLHSNVSTVVKISSNRRELFFKRGLYIVTAAKYKLFGVYATRIHIPNTNAHYRLLQKTDYVSVNQFSGDVYIHRAISSGSCSILTISANIPSNSEQALTNLFLFNRDVTAYSAGRFQRDKYFFRIYENSPIGSIVGHVVLDNSKNITKTFFVESGNVRDILSVTNDGYVKINNNLNREEINEFRLVITVIMNCTMVKTNVTIQVLDVNDNSPSFTSNESVVHIDWEDVRVPGVIYTIKAIDLDVGQNSVIKYELVDNGYGSFIINSKTGQVYVIKKLGPYRWYRLKIRAFDHGKPAMESFSNVIIKSIQVKTIVLYSFLSSKQRIFVPFYKIPKKYTGHAAEPLFVLRTHANVFGLHQNGWIFFKKESVKSKRKASYKLFIQASFPDQVFNITVVVFIQRNYAEIVFEKATYFFVASENTILSSVIGNISLKTEFRNAVLYVEEPDPWIRVQGETLKLRKKLDCNEIQKKYGDCTIFLQVRGVTTDLNSSCVVVLTVRDETNHGPTFPSKFISVAIHESRRPMFPKDLIVANDGDITPNDKVHYKIFKTFPNNHFQIDLNTGILTPTLATTQQLQSRYDLKILAYDPTQPSLNDTLSLCINVIERFYRISPISSANMTKITIIENTTLGTVVYKLDLIDTDRNDVIFQITALDYYFVIHPNRGEVQLVQALDYELQKSHEIEILVNNSHSSYTTFVKFIIENVNDNAPSLSQTNRKWTTKDTLSVGSIIQSCIARDYDGDQMAFSFTSTSRELKQFVTLHSTNCSLQLIKDLKYLRSNREVFRIQAFDGQHKTYFTVTLFIQRWSSPVIISPAAVVVQEGVKIGDKLYELRVHQIYNEEGVVFKLQDGYSSLFAINSSNGCVLIKSIWPKHIWKLQMVMKVTSKYGVTSTLNVVFFKVERHPSTLSFLSSLSVRSLYENNEKNYELSIVQAKYTIDIFPTNVNHFITSGDHDGSFSINATSGKLIILDSLDRERIGNIVMLDIYAVDMAKTTPHTAKTQVEVRIINRNDNSPEFVDTNLEYYVQENTELMSVITTVTAIDIDQDQTRYKLESEFKYFMVNESNGAIVVINSLLNKTSEDLLLNISAEDNGNPPRKSYILLIVHVTDFNDHVPEFNQSTYFLTIDESFPRGEVVTTVNAEDADVGLNAEIEYSIVSGDYGYFSIDANLGIIYSVKQLKCEEICVFFLIIGAVDNGKPLLSSTTLVLIKVRNFPALQFEKDVYNITVREEDHVTNSLVFVPRFKLSNYSTQVNSAYYFSMFGENLEQFYIAKNGSVVFNQTPIQPPKSNRLIRFLLTASTKPRDSPWQVEIFTIINVKIVKGDDGDTDTSCLLDIKPIFVSENASVGSIVGSVSVCRTNMTYKSTQHSSSFRIHSTNGHVVLLQPLDFEKQTGFILEILVVVKLSTKFISQNLTLPIIVLDANDNAPVILTVYDTFTILINTLKPSTVIGQLNASDADSGENAKLVFQTMTYTDIFYIDSQNGSFYVRDEELLKSNKSSYELEVLVSDSGKPILQTLRSFIVKVIEKNTPPRFEKHVYKTNVSENDLPSTSLLKVKANNTNIQSSSKQNSILLYFILSCFPCDGYFSLNSTTGDLTLLKPVDREQFTYFNITVSVQDGGTNLTNYATILVTITDVNDCTPVFLQSDKVAGTVYENGESNIYVMTVKAYDLDSGINGLLGYSLLNNKHHFKINNHNGVVTTVHSFDYETRSEFTLQVEVRDSAPPHHKNVTKFVISILDVNDSPPEILQPRDIVYLPNNLPIGSFIVGLVAHDNDTFAYARMIFSIASSDFCIEENTGVITNTKNLSAGILYNFTAFVLDPTFPLHNDSIMVKIQLTDKKLVPTIQPTFSFFNVVENDMTFIKHPLLQLTRGKNSPSAIFNIVSSTTNSFAINTTTSSLYLLSPLDYEQMTRHVVWISLTSSVDSELKSYAKVVIYVTNINDNGPVFREKWFSIKIPENSQERIVTNVMATDVDMIGEIFYTLNDTKNFSIGKENGTIFRQVRFDYEKQNNYSLLIFATDELNNTSPDGILNLQIQILNINDNPPIINEGPNVISVFEDFAVFTDFYNFSVSDIDDMETLQTSINNTCCVVIHKGSNERSLQFIHKLDREIIDVLLVNISVNDGYYTVSKDMTIKILDINDNPPRFETKHFIFSINENVTVNTIFHRFHILDKDTGENALSNTSIVSNDSSIKRYFRLNSNELKILKSPWIRGLSRFFKFTVKAMNTAPPFHVTSTNITVNIVDINDHYPVFKEDIYNVYVNSEIQYGSTIKMIEAVDVFDIGDNARISYNIFGGNGSSLFEILGNGSIRVKTSLMMHVNEIRTIEVVANDNGTPILGTNCTVHVFIEPMNRFPPNILGAPYAKTIPEDTPINKEVLRITVNDKETGNKLFFYIISGDENKLWNIRNNGSLFLQKPLDFEKRTIYRLAVQIFDDTFHDQKSAMTNITISVTDVNDNAPIFTKSHYHAFVTENFDISVPVCHVSATDSDSPVNSKITYNMSDPLFYIGQNTGAVYTKHSFDFEKQNIYTFVIESRDNGSPHQSSFVNVSLSVTGINEYPPVASVQSYFFNISRIQNIGSKFGIICATDYDAGIDGKCFFQISIPRKLGFAIGYESGELSTIDRVATGNYEFHVMIFNLPRDDEYNGVIQFYTTSRVNVQVYDVMLAPSFVNSSYHVTVKENITVGECFLVVAAIHHDGNENIIYSLANNTNEFMMIESTGQLLIASTLDYEKRQSYHFQAVARNLDSAKAYTDVFVTVLDVNDNAPMQTHRCFGSILENTLPGLYVTTVNVSDADDYPNGGPFNFVLIDNSDEFVINQKTGLIKSKKSFDREQMGSYEVQVLVEDSGNPSRSSNITCYIEVSDKNDNRGRVRNVTILTTKLDFGEMNDYLGDISPLDSDLKSSYNCSFAAPHESLVFRENSCELYIKPEIKDIQRSMEVDYFGQHQNEENILSRLHVTFRYINPIWFDNIITTIQISNCTVKEFITKWFVAMEMAVNNLMTVRDLQVFIASVKEEREGVVIVFVLSSTSRIYASLFRHSMEVKLKEIAKDLQLSNNLKMFDPCRPNNCTKPQSCYATIQFSGFEILSTDNLIYHSRTFNVTYRCRCRAGFFGPQCKQSIKTCDSRPCFNGGICTETNTNTASKDQKQIRCTCSKSFQGLFCENDVNECDRFLCKNGGNCINKYGAFFCECPPKFSGELCELKKSPCQPNPCQNNATCISSSEIEYQCTCRFGDSGTDCDKRSLNFRASSFLKIQGRFNLLNFTLTLRLATVQKNALVLHARNKLLEFVIILEEGKLNVCIQNRTETMTVIIFDDNKVYDGNFHRLDVVVTEQFLTVTLDKRKKISRMSTMDGISTQFTSLSFGGIESLEKYHLYQTHHKHFLAASEFIGCIGDLLINSVAMDAVKIVDHSVGVTVGCKRRDTCVDNPCGYGNECIDRWSEYECRCQGNYIASGCMRDHKAVKFPNRNSVINLCMSKSLRRKELLAKSIRKRRQVLFRQSHVVVDFRTRHSSGIIFNSTEKSTERTLIYLSSGYVHYKFQHGNSTGKSSISDLTVNDGEWHSIAISTQGQTTSLKLDDSVTIRHTFPQFTHQFISQGKWSYEIGRDFEGCFGRFKLNNYTLYLSGSTSLFKVSKSTSIENGCIPINVCSHLPCENSTFKYCVDEWEKYTCVEAGMCDHKPCHNDGDCVPLNPTSFSCNCIRTQYDGRLCETPLVCLSEPCKVSEKCRIDGAKYKCIADATTTKKDGMSTTLIAVIVTSVIISIVIIGIFIAYLSSRRSWKAKDLKVIKAHNFNDIIVDERPFQDYEPCDNANTYSEQTNKRKRSLEVVFYDNDNDVIGRYDNVSYKGSRDDVIRRVSSDGGFYSPRMDDHRKQMCESGFESESDVIDNCFRVNYECEIYELECAGAQFSEANFQYDEPTLYYDEDHLETSFSKNKMSCDIESESEAYFTCSECDHDSMRQSYRGTKNPTFVISRSNPTCEECDYVSDTSSHDTNFSNESPRKPVDMTEQPEHRKRRKSDLRRQVLSRSIEARFEAGYDIGCINNAYELENVLETEEYV